ncbi:alpha/beta hydrolase [Novosphingobium piscinae]|uniref:Alpha/beta hydrolase n=1 Tax=Novosphingobium piscinae TaxID=1507448 RepID=A0A7X1FZU6_9SPHN|nr:alpha/beta hydrolase [Novosphingobium piscinae]MBC2669894.1 alpha/beta hydrolase [Novosphingobium piscinae]
MRGSTGNPLARLALGAVLTGLILASPVAAAREEAPLRLWPQGAPAIPGWPGIASVPVPERLEAVPGDPWSDNVANVADPTLQPFLPAPGTATGAAVIVAPGGGFHHLAMRKEGTAVAAWLADHGIAAFVLKYRLVQHEPGESADALRRRVNSDPRFRNGVAGMPGLADGLAALRLVRARAADWGLDPHRVGVVGFSAGGHIAGMMALTGNPAERPDFVGLIYGMPFLIPFPDLPAANLPWPPGTPKEPWLRPKPTPAPGALPPMFLAQAQDDVLVGPELGGFYAALTRAGYQPELHLYARGGHGFGMKPQGLSSDRWIESFRSWITAGGFDRARPAAP